jgi:hypothetical protein
MKHFRIIAGALVPLTLFGAAFIPAHIDPALGLWAIAVRFVVFATISALIAKMVPQKTGVAIVGSILLAGVTIGLREFVMRTQVAEPNLIAGVAGSVWGAALAHGMRRNLF